MTPSSKWSIIVHHWCPSSESEIPVPLPKRWRINLWSREIWVKLPQAVDLLKEVFEIPAGKGNDMQPEKSFWWPCQHFWRVLG